MSKSDTTQQIEEKIEKLVEELRYHEDLYYNKNTPEISDKEYDDLLRVLAAYESAYPELAREDSPTRKLFKERIEDFKEVEHSEGMLSLGNTYNEAELREFDKRVKKGLGTDRVEYVVELKIDGISIAIRYKNGLFVQGITRGDGRSGYDVTQNLRHIKNLPGKLNKDVSFEVRGEVFMRIPDFERLNQVLLEKGESPFANPRNSTAGSIKLKDTNEAKSRPLDIFLYQVVNPDNQIEQNTHWEYLKIVSDLGLPVNKKTELVGSIDEVFKLIDFWKDERDKLDYETDGLVIKLNDINHRQKLGFTAKEPRWAIAYKFPAKQMTTVIESVELQVGRTGTITPVANLIPVSLAGTTVKRATLHNFDEIEKKDIRVKDTVLIEKGGEIIPKVVKVIKEKRPDNSTPIIPPGQCPVCGSKTDNDPGEVAVRCSNVACPAQVKEKIIYFASKPAMNIDHLGRQNVIRFVDLGLLSDYSDIYYLDRNRIENLDKFGKKSADNLFDSIEKSKENPLFRLITGLGIRYIGQKAARTLAANFTSIDRLSRAAESELTAINEIGDVMAKSITAFFNNHRNIEVLEKLKQAGIKWEEQQSDNSIGLQGELFQNLQDRSADDTAAATRFKGKKIVITGTIEGYTRDEAKELVIKLGGNPVTSVSAKTDYVIAGENPGSKVDKAKSLGVEIISSNEFLNLINI